MHIRKKQLRARILLRQHSCVRLIGLILIIFSGMMFIVSRQPTSADNSLVLDMPPNPTFIFTSTPFPTVSTPPTRTLTVAPPSSPTLSPSPTEMGTPIFEDKRYVLQIDTYHLAHTISPYIYGVNLADSEMGERLNLSVNRYGGNSVSRYNWKNSSTNLGGDWYFLGVPQGEEELGLPHGSVTDLFVEQNRRTGAESLLTIPMMGYVSKSRSTSCGFSVARYGPQTSVEPWHPDCGNGQLVDSIDGRTRIAWADPFDTSIAVDESFVQEWIDHLTEKYGAGNEGGVQFYSLDNEPMLWFYTHQDIHPKPVGYDEIRDRTYQYAPAIKQSDPSAKTLGPAVWGWHAYFRSAVDQESPFGPIDQQAHGNVPFLEWYLQQMAAYEAQHGVRILDYLDLHYYPQGEGITVGEAGDRNIQQRRLDSTRTLWDPHFDDGSWIGEPTFLIPRMHTWVDNNYPDTQLSISEYNFGGLDHINGAVTQADVLGIFGRENLHMAMLWGWRDIQVDQPWAFAFQMYRNYDGQKSTFGDQHLNAVSSNESDVSVFASRRSEDDALTVIAINKTFDAAEVALQLDGFKTGDPAAIYRYSEQYLHHIQKVEPRPILNQQIQDVLPAQSINLYVIKNGLFAPPTHLDDSPTDLTPSPKPESTNPREADYQWSFASDQDEAVDAGWFVAEAPAGTFDQDILFEVKFGENFSDPGQSISQVGSLGSDDVLQFEVGFFTKAHQIPAQAKAGQGVTITLRLGGEIAQKLYTGNLALKVFSGEKSGWMPVAGSEISHDGYALTFDIKSNSSLAIKKNSRPIFLPIVVP